jgi:NAD(P) transhydrogenase subunit beta
MLTLIPQFTIGATGLIVVFLFMSFLAMLTIFLVVLFYVFSINMAGTSPAIDAGLALFAFVVSKLWIMSMLPMLALYNGIGGGAAGAIAAVELFGNMADGVPRPIVTLIGALIGAVSLSGSLVAWTKFNGRINGPSRVSGWRTSIWVVIATTIVVGTYTVFIAQGFADQVIASPGLMSLLFGCALLLGALMTLSIRRAQMPMLVSMYNAFTSLAVGLEGFVLRSPTLMIAGMAVGSARMLLTLPLVKR